MLFNMCRLLYFYDVEHFKSDSRLPTKWNIVYSTNAYLDNILQISSITYMCMQKTDVISHAKCVYVCIIFEGVCVDSYQVFRVNEFLDAENILFPEIGC